ncbi:MAG: squalene--hopene cyclase [Candidatus Dormibacteraeota bacterium]|uniref:Squalene--hopene cyclase n=1 Tax=Candidatus Aeolococcus gillhamiae TaxID=3127015 RepID=A0A934K3W8_9BACT|nr:squalene--hopene cyclase [Candidatus Dormibacteraeota bacterium]
MQREHAGVIPGSRAAVSAAVDHLLERQDARGWWSGELETNVTMTSEHVLLLAFLGLPHDDIRDGAIRHLLGCQREDGSWGLYHDAPADLSTTIEAYVALRVLGLDGARPELSQARRAILEQGGVAHARVFTKIWLALFGAYPWEGVPSMPPELVWLPPRVPLNLYDFACWARGTIAPLLIVISRRPCRPLPFSLAELVLPGTEWRLRRVEASGPFAWADHLQKQYERLRIHPGRSAARRRLVKWIRARQEADGSWGGIQPPWVYSLIALHLEGMPLDHEVMRRGLTGLDRFAVEDDGGWRLQACMSPVWDTALAILALRRAGMPAHATPLRRAVEWLVDEQIVGGGDWQVRCAPGTEGGGWAFEFDNDIYPDVDDTAVVVLALLEAEQTDEVRNAVARAQRWVAAMRSSDGAWAAFDRDNVRQVVYSLPFADFGAMLDPPSEDVTAHAIEMFSALGVRPDAPLLAPAIAYLRGAQAPEGSWFGRWGVNHVYGTWCVVSALAPLHIDDRAVSCALAWTERVQNHDGGWGETCASYRDPSFAGVGSSTASQTAWAMLTLQAGGVGDGVAASSGARHLIDRQSAGTWEEPEHTGTGFPGDFYINYHLYRHVFPLMALARYASTDA